MGNSFITYAGIQVSWTVTSDKHWKKNIRELPYGLEVVKQLKPVDYVRKNNDAKTREMGFIAQDVEVLLAKIGYTDQGFLHKDDKGFMSLRYNDFIALLTKAIQEQQDIIEEQ
ncbi:tail fiber domain-containing protein, partial [Flavobacteriaceae bacterium AH-315-B10]|nr:tail fiber domain-containing protein [Flavobacteriaceae bacterium AH-315-B10]